MPRIGELQETLQDMTLKSRDGEILDESEWDMDRWVPGWQGSAVRGAPSSGSPQSPALSQSGGRAVRSRCPGYLPSARRMTAVHRQGAVPASVVVLSTFPWLWEAQCTHLPRPEMTRQIWVVSPPLSPAA